MKNFIATVSIHGDYYLAIKAEDLEEAARLAQVLGIQHAFERSTVEHVTHLHQLDDDWHDDHFRGVTK